MATKPETTFYTGLNKHVPRHVYRMKNNNPFLGGVPDFWYSGNAADLWVEYKWIPRVPRSGIVDVGKLLSALQLKWLADRYDEGRNVCVIAGCSTGGVVLRDRLWEKPVVDFHSLIRSRQDLASWIVSQTTR